MLGPWEWAIIALIALLIFGGTRLAGIGKSAGKAIREFKEETATPPKQVPGSTPEPTEPTTIVESDPDTKA
mgnify:FL=1